MNVNLKQIQSIVDSVEGAYSVVTKTLPTPIITGYSDGRAVIETEITERILNFDAVIDMTTGVISIQTKSPALEATIETHLKEGKV